MTLLNTRFYVDRSLSRQKFLNFVRQWIVGSSAVDVSLEGFDFDCESFENESESHQRIEICNYSDIFLLSYICPGNGGSVYSTRYVLDDKSDKPSMYLSQTKSFTKATLNDKQESVDIPEPIKQLFWNEYGGDDNGLITDSSPIVLRKTDAEKAKAILDNADKYLNPIVYVSPIQATGDYNVDYNAVARDLQGQAHVIVENSPVAANAIADITNKANPYNGSARIYTPDGQHETILCGGQDSENRIVSKVREILSHVETDDRFDADKIRQKHMLSKFSDSEMAKLCEDMLADKDSEIRKLRSQIEELSYLKYEAVAKAEGLKNNLETKQAESQKSLGFEITESDLYDGEISTVILKVLQKEYDNMKDDPNLSKCRKFDVLSDILDHNFPCTTDADLVECIRSAFKDGVLTKEGIGRLQSSGFTIVKAARNAHYRVTYNNDDRYVCMFSATPSDKKRSAKNCVADFANVLFGY